MTGTIEYATADVVATQRLYEHLGVYLSKCRNLYRPPKVEHPKVKELIEAIQAEPDT